MVQKIWTQRQMPEVKKLQGNYSLPQEVVDRIEDAVMILDNFYDPERVVDIEDGGYVCLILPDSENNWQKSYSELLETYKLNKEDIEYADILYENDAFEWRADLYLASCEFALLIIYQRERKGCMWKL